MLTRRRPPAVAGRYVLLEPIGRGATGTVHRARDLRLRRDVAAKVLHPATDDVGAGALLRFVREQGHRIDHPHVLSPLGWAAEDDVALIAMELVPGGSLRDLLAARGALPEADVARLLGQLLQALAAVHARGVVHGDVKPANLLLRSRPGEPSHLLLADFGVATCRTDPLRLVVAGSARDGTPAFLPPEARAGAEPDPSRDVYAAGVVARRALADGGALRTLCDSMTRPEAHLRPSADQAWRRLRELPVAPATRAGSRSRGRGR